MEIMDGKRVKSENLEVTGVSRSGRVRKKSSKLMDFESPDEVENKYRRKPETTPRQERPRKSPVKLKPQPEIVEEEVDDSMYEQSFANNSRDEEIDSEGDAYKPDNDDEQYDDEDDLDEDDDDFADGNLVVDEKTPTQSLYMMEKSKKKIIMKDGRAVAAAKTQRKDKGKSRFTAYMMWAREIRKVFLRKHPETNISMTARRLSEMWATVPAAEREQWKRKAKRECLVKARAAKTGAPLMPSRKFINKKGGPIAPLLNSTPVIPPKVQVLEQPPVKVRKIDTTLSTVGYRVTGQTPLDIAAHLKLLGESLTIIGERLQEHEGQIAVSGSLSVLLDSLLCAMGPLLCLTMQVDGIQVDPDILSKILQNIAYVMPGLG